MRNCMKCSFLKKLVVDSSITPLDAKIIGATKISLKALEALFMQKLRKSCIFFH